MRDPRTEIVGYGLAHIRQCGASAEVLSDFLCRGISQDRNIFAGVVSSLPARVGVATVVGGENQQVARVE